MHVIKVLYPLSLKLPGQWSPMIPMLPNTVDFSISDSIVDFPFIAQCIDQCVSLHFDETTPQDSSAFSSSESKHIFQLTYSKHFNYHLYNDSQTSISGPYLSPEQIHTLKCSQVTSTCMSQLHLVSMVLISAKGTHPLESLKSEIWEPPQPPPSPSPNN